MLKQNYEVEVLINGKAAKEYIHKEKFYIEGRKGTRFSIKIRNNSYQRKLFVPTIDGLSVMNGEEGNFQSSGYIVQGYSSITIDGWRTSDKEVASFYFSSPEGSYRKRMKRGNNLGIIGVAVFNEKSTWTTYATATTPGIYTGNQPYTMPNTWPSYTVVGGSCLQNSGTNNYNVKGIESSVNLCCASASGSSPVQSLGTGFGEAKTSEVTSVSFDRENTPDAIFEINYNTREELERAGVNFKKEPLYVTPQAFPGQYCKPPLN